MTAMDPAALAQQMLADPAFQRRLQERIASLDMAPFADRSLIIGMFLDAPPPGSVTESCQGCATDVIIGPDSQRVAAQYPDKVAKVCMECAIAIARATKVRDVYRARNVP